MARAARAALDGAGLLDLLYDDDSDEELAEEDLAHPLVFKRVPRDHALLPRAYFREIVDAAGFAHVVD
jgi:hypothetical protein